MGKFITTFREFIKESLDNMDDFQIATDNREKFQAEHEEDWYTYAKEKIKEVFGQVESFSGSADWGGIPVWSVTGGRFEGTFVIMDDDNNVILMTRKTTEEEHIDNDLMRADEYDVEGLTALLIKAKSIKDESKAKWMQGRDKFSGLKN